MIKIALKTVIEIVSIKSCIDREIKRTSSQFSYTVIVVTQTGSS